MTGTEMFFYCLLGVVAILLVVFIVLKIRILWNLGSRLGKK